MRPKDVVVAFDAQVGVAVRRPSTLPRATTGPRAGATAATGNGPAPILAVTTTAAGLVPLVAVALLPGAAGVPPVRAPVAVLVGPGVRPVLPRAVTGVLLLPPAGDARAPRRAVAGLRAPARQAGIAKGANPMVAAAGRVAEQRISRLPPLAVRGRARAEVIRSGRRPRPVARAKTIQALKATWGPTPPVAAPPLPRATPPCARRRGQAVPP